MDASNKRVAKNTIFLYIRMLAVMLVSLFTVRVVLRTLGAEDYGIYNVVGGVVTLMVFLNSALGASTSRYLTYELGRGDKKKLSDTFSASLTLHIIVALIVAILAETIGLWFFYNKLVIAQERLSAAFWVFQFSIISMAINFTQVPYSASLISHENMSAYAYVGIYEAVSKLIIASVIAYAPFDRLVFYALLILLNTVAIQLFYRFYTVKRYDECHFQIVKDKTLYKELASYSGWDLLGGIAGVSQGQGINMLINMFFGALANAARAIAVNVSSAASGFVNNIMVAARPQVVKRFAENNIAGMYDLTFSCIKYALILIMAINLPLIIEMRFVLDLWLGEGYPQEAILFSQIVLTYAAIQAVDVGLNMPYHAIGRIKTGNIIGGTIMISALPISYLFFKLGAPAYVAFIIVACSTTSSAFVTLLLIRRYRFFSIRFFFIKFLLPVILVLSCTIVIPLAVHYSLPNGILRFALVLVCTESLLFLSTWFILLGKTEREYAVNYIKNKLGK